MSAPTPFTLRVPDADIADLGERLGRTRYPDAAPGEAWAYGTSVDYLRDLVSYWRDGFDWRAAEARLNAFPQFKLVKDDIDLHFLHVQGRGPNPCPLLLLHGWPGSVFEFLDFIPRLTDPAKFGGDPSDSFTMVAPSLPGYGLSFRPGQMRYGVEEIADAMAELMSETLGYRRFAVQGGDWGGITAGTNGIRARRSAYRHSRQFAGRPARSEGDHKPRRRAESLCRGVKRLARRRDRVSMDSGHEAADAKFRPDQFARRTSLPGSWRNSVPGPIAVARSRPR